jgi:hypothetical protein
MITQKIKDLFQFIEFLHSNINNFNQYNDLIKELELLVEERKKVSHKSTFKDKLKFNEVQAEIETKSETIQANTANLIKAKAKELKVCNFEKELIYSFIDIETEIRQIENNFSIEDLPEILNHKTKYIEYREKTKGKVFLSLGRFFGDLDKGLKELFDYFIETDYNEFETFKTKAIQANDVTETAKLMQLGHSKFTLPDSFLTPSNIQQQPNIEPLPPHPINSKTDIGKYKTKHYVLAYLFECNAKGESFPIGNKKELERIGNERMGAGKGNRFYKVFNEVINKDLNAEKNLFEIGGEYWRKAVIELSKAPELVEKYLQSKQI